MESIIEILYGVTMEQGSLKNFKTSENDDEEDFLYEDLRKTFTDKQTEQFERFIYLYGCRLAKETEKAYRLGFKTGALLTVEVLTPD
ncbi:MAG: hypothetical protein IJA89_02435 [Clostridia bacterium]|nr:hypothetical protein [Clostridia bacterium]